LGRPPLPPPSLWDVPLPPLPFLRFLGKKIVNVSGPLCLTLKRSRVDLPLSPPPLLPPIYACRIESSLRWSVGMRCRLPLVKDKRPCRAPSPSALFFFFNSLVRLPRSRQEPNNLNCSKNRQSLPPFFFSPPSPFPPPSKSRCKAPPLHLLQSFLQCQGLF